MKNFSLCLTICILGILLLAGCGQTKTSGKEKVLERAPQAQYDDAYITVGFVQTGKESDWRDANTNDYFTVFTKEEGYNLIYVDGNSDSDRQVKAVYDLIAQGVDYIIIDPIVEDGWEETLCLAKEKGIPVLIVDRKVSADPSLYKCWIGSDFNGEGRKAINFLEEYLEKSGRENDKLNIVILEGTKGATAAIGRTEGLKSEIEKHPNWKIVTMECANFTQGEGNVVMEEILKKHPKFDVLISENDNMMFGAMNAMDQAGVGYGVDGGVITISFDALREAFVKMDEGKLCASVECNPLIAKYARKAIEDMESGKAVAADIYIPEKVFTYENYADYMDSRKY